MKILSKTPAKIAAQRETKKGFVEKCIFLMKRKEKGRKKVCRKVYQIEGTSNAHLFVCDNKKYFSS